MHKTILVFLVFGLMLFAQEEIKEAPNFSLKSLDGNQVELNSFLGNGPVLISFWATWCKPCVAELKYFNEYYNEFKEKGFTMIAVSTDSERSVSKVRPFVKANNYDFPVLLDTNSEVARMYYARMIPYTVILDKTGNIVYTHVGYKKGDELEVKEIIEKLLSESK